MEIKPANTTLLDWAGDALAVGFFENDTELTGNLAQLNEKLQGTLSELIQEADFKGKTGTRRAHRSSRMNRRSCLQ